MTLWSVVRRSYVLIYPVCAVFSYDLYIRVAVLCTVDNSTVLRVIAASRPMCETITKVLLLLLPYNRMLGHCTENTYILAVYIALVSLVGDRH